MEYTSDGDSVLLVFAFSRAATRGDSRGRAVGMFFVVFLVKNALTR